MFELGSNPPKVPPWLWHNDGPEPTEPDQQQEGILQYFASNLQKKLLYDQQKYEKTVATLDNKSVRFIT